MNRIILVPTDFSHNAWVATQYAAHLALEKKKKLILLHAFRPFYSSFTSIGHNIQVLEEATKIVNAEMDLIGDKLKAEFPTLDYEGICLEGNLTDVIARKSKEISIELIIMGTKGATGLRYALMGSNAFDVINKSQIPVLAVPNESRYKLEKVGILSNYKNSEISVLNSFIKIVGNTFAGVLLHVHEEDSEVEQTYAEAWRELVKEESGLQELKYKVGSGEDIPAVINQMMDDEDVDLLLVTNNARSFMKSLFNKDMVKALALKPQVPILFIKV